MTEIPCVGAVVFDDTNRLLLVKRANPPAQGMWSLPGGRLESGETAEQGVVREVCEETG
jgi:ADP-ribose pyrophosphatase YjhB (NUDIX family)